MGYSSFAAHVKKISFPLLSRWHDEVDTLVHKAEWYLATRCGDVEGVSNLFLMLFTLHPAWQVR
jgi:hypothetical protein